MHIRQADTALVVSGRGPTQNSYTPPTDPVLLTFPRFKYFTPLLRNEIFNSPHQLILLFATIKAILLSIDASESKIHELETLLHMKGNQLNLTEVLDTCYRLVFCQNPTAGKHESINSIITPAGTGNSTLNAYILMVLQQLNLPFCFTADLDQFDLYKGSMALYFDGMNLYSTTHTNHIPDIPHRTKPTIFIQDRKDEVFSFLEWQDLRGEWSAVCATKNPNPLAFTFTPAPNPMSAQRHPKMAYSHLPTLAETGVFPFYFSPSTKNHRLGMVQLYLLRQLSSEAFLVANDFAPDQENMDYFGEEMMKHLGDWKDDLTTIPSCTNDIKRLELVHNFANNPNLEPLLVSISYHPLVALAQSKNFGQTLLQQQSARVNKPAVKAVKPPTAKKQKSSKKLINSVTPQHPSLSPPDLFDKPLFGAINNLFEDIAVFATVGMPTVRYFSFISSKTGGTAQITKSLMRGLESHRIKLKYDDETIRVQEPFSRIFLNLPTEEDEQQSESDE